jgi:hypothetical protein
MLADNSWTEFYPNQKKNLEISAKFRLRPEVNHALHLTSGFHRAPLLSVTFINQLMHSIITVVDVKICYIKV